jgi:hypothetical protein
MFIKVHMKAVPAKQAQEELQKNFSLLVHCPLTDLQE